MVDEEEHQFVIEQRPTRRYPWRGGVEHDGGTVFSLYPEEGTTRSSLSELVVSVLASGPYRYGEWFDLPMPLYLVHDDETGDTFRVAIRDGRVELHVLPETQSDGLCDLFQRLVDASDSTWTVERRIESPQPT